jgi:hypothetical protein
MIFLNIFFFPLQYFWCLYIAPPIHSSESQIRKHILPRTKSTSYQTVYCEEVTVRHLQFLTVGKGDDWTPTGFLARSSITLSRTRRFMFVIYRFYWLSRVKMHLHPYQLHLSLKGHPIRDTSTCIRSPQVHPIPPTHPRGWQVRSLLALLARKYKDCFPGAKKQKYKYWRCILSPQHSHLRNTTILIGRNAPKNLLFCHWSSRFHLIYIFLYVSFAWAARDGYPRLSFASFHIHHSLAWHLIPRALAFFLSCDFR